MISEVFFNYGTSLASQITKLESSWNFPVFMKWLNANVSYSWTFAGGYACAIFLATRYMKRRPAMNLRTPLVLWSALLAVFSTLGAIRMGGLMVDTLLTKGFYYSVCRHPYGTTQVDSFWGPMFVLSKVVELGDTAFIVLRKRKLAFLHWYHHITVLLYVWHSYNNQTAPAYWYCVMNYVVHSFMYTYYTLAALQFRMPAFLKKSITALQLIQMVFGSCLTVSSLYWKMGEGCRQSNRDLTCAITMYGSYLVLFAKFYYEAYMKPKSESRDCNKLE